MGCSNSSILPPPPRPVVSNVMYPEVDIAYALLLQSRNILPERLCVEIFQQNPRRIQTDMQLETQHIHSAVRSFNSASIGNMLYLFRTSNNAQLKTDCELLLKSWLQYVSIHGEPPGFKHFSPELTHIVNIVTKKQQQ